LWVGSFPTSGGDLRHRAKQTPKRFFRGTEKHGAIQRMLEEPGKCDWVARYEGLQRHIAAKLCAARFPDFASTAFAEGREELVLAEFVAGFSSWKREIASPTMVSNRLILACVEVNVRVPDK
jgi:hypothetical protein